jgi:hypothetical protein
MAGKSTGRAMLAAVVASLSLVTSCSSSRHTAVTTPEAAVAAAKNAWSGVYDKTQRPQYSSKETEKFEPYSATLDDGIWTVKGTIPLGFRGETLVTTVRAKDASATVTVLAID